MLQIRRILHPTDFSTGARAALGHALHLARRHDAVLHVLHVIPTFGSDPLRGAFDASLDEAAFYRRLREAADVQIDAALGAFDTTGVVVERVSSRGNAPAPVILDYARDERMDLIVMGTHGRRGFRDMLLGSVTQEVVRRAYCPILTVRTPAGDGVPEVKVGRVLAPVDFSDSSREAVRCAKALAALYEAPLDLLHVVGVPRNPELYDQSFPLFDQVKENAVAASMQGLRQLAEETDGPPVATVCHVRTGYPAREIVTFAESRPAGLVVMATHGLTGLQHFLFGSVSEKVVQRAPCPVFVVRSFGHSLLPEPSAPARADEEKA